MATLIELICDNIVRNTGRDNCGIDLNRLSGWAWVPKSVSYTPAQYATGDLLLAALQASAYNANKALRIYPFSGVNGFEAANTDATTETSGYGDIRTLLDTKIGFTFSLWDIGSCLASNLMSFSRQQNSFRLLIWDIDGVVAGTKIQSGANAGNLTGYDLSNLYVPPRTFNTGAAGVVQTVQMQLKNGYNQFGKDFIYVKTDDVNDLKAINDIQLVDITSTILPTPAAGIYYVRVVSGCGGDSVAAIFHDILDVTTQGTVWTSTNNTDGGVITITAVTYDAPSDSMKFVFDTTDTDWTTGEDVKLQIVGTAALAALGLVGFEANPNFIVLPN